ncbi:transposase domain-containing protein [Paracoccus sp. (in: a-proteobacteria)]|uniref:transposase domain-containing protein n=1 Tax=Paracoccus sp. TaxID=267 RepID=UPI0039E48196
MRSSPGMTRPGDPGRIASLTAPAKVNGVKPFACLKAILQAVAAGRPQAKIDDLLPWICKPAS